MSKAIVLALGGNAIDNESCEEEGKNILKTLNGLELLKDRPLVITHGNGPQVGRQFSKLNLPLWICTGQTQGEIGPLIQQSVIRYFKRQKIKQTVVTLCTHVLINPKDPSLHKPSKPIGNFFAKAEAEEMIKKGIQMGEDPANRGWRRIVPSPKPQAIVEIDAIKALIKKNYIVIAGGGGGIPVYKTPDGLTAVDAVIDKDYTSALIAEKIKAEMLILLTNVETVKLDFCKPTERSLRNLRTEEAKRLLKEGIHFATGMKTKIDAAVEFIENGGKKVIITHILKLKEALESKTGTIIEK